MFQKEKTYQKFLYDKLTISSYNTNRKCFMFNFTGWKIESFPDFHRMLWIMIQSLWTMTAIDWPLGMAHSDRPWSMELSDLFYWETQSNVTSMALSVPGQGSPRSFQVVIFVYLWFDLSDFPKNLQSTKYRSQLIVLSPDCGPILTI